ncbi:hypothetical protein PSEUDO9AZ_40169 [Pseudomonas sp. 9AZ]|uniref:TIR domain-containing protein n=1 Tax=Pseudomonas sp. 9AZ TaxID=2653168 RepID=UPI0012F468E7|nr:TIR domain-containing protein [Pseudomonas sp. 9AZ]VXD00042.1 hypothetical protein PSEUDO9AZ_40169 [Pseudomonas sp. 9AZ]
MAHPREYHAFISYRHADNKAQGRQWASWLHHALETYEVPAELVGKLNLRNEPIPERIYPVFRDEEELPAYADLGNSISQALSASRLLVVICSPNAVSSSYVADEILFFKKLGKSDRIIAAMIAGEPNASWDTAKTAAGFQLSDECFPLPLQFETDAQGDLTACRAEPIAADFRINHNGLMEEGWTTPAAYRQHLQTTTNWSAAKIAAAVEAYNQQLQLMLLKIIAAVLAIPLGELTQRDKSHQLAKEKQKARRLRQWLSGMAALTLLAITAGGIAYQQRQIAQANEHLALQQRNQALTNESRFLTFQADQQLAQGQADKAMLLALNALPGTYGGDRPLHQPALDLLYRASVSNHKQAEFAHRDEVLFWTVSQDKSLLLSLLKNGNALVWDTKLRKVVHELEHPQSPYRAFISPNGRWLLTADHEQQVYIWDLASGTLKRTLTLGEHLYSAQFSPDSRQIILLGDKGKPLLLNTEADDQLFQFPQPYLANIGIFGTDGRQLITVSNDGHAIVWDVIDNKKLKEYLLTERIVALELDSTNELLLTRSLDNKVRLWSLSTGQQQWEYEFDDIPTQARFNANSTLILASSADGTAIILDANTGEPIELPRTEALQSRHMYDLDEIWDARFVDNGFGKQQAVVTYSAKGIQLWSTVSGQWLGDITTGLEENVGIAFGNDSVFALTDTHTLAHWDTFAGSPQLAHRVQETNIDWSESVVSPDNQWFLTEANNDTNLATLWQRGQAQPITNLGHKGSFDLVTISDKAGLVAITSGAEVPEVEMLDMHSGKSLRKFAIPKIPGIASLAFNHQGNHLLITTYKNFVLLLDVPTGQIIHRFEHPGLHPGYPAAAVRAASFSRDGQWIATASTDGVVNIWSSVTGKKYQTLTLDQRRIHYVALKGEGKLQLEVVYRDDHRAVYSLDGSLISETNAPVIAKGALTADAGLHQLMAQVIGQTLHYSINGAQGTVPLPPSAASAKLKKLVLSEDGSQAALLMDSETVLQLNISSGKLTPLQMRARNIKSVAAGELGHSVAIMTGDSDQLVVKPVDSFTQNFALSADGSYNQAGFSADAKYAFTANINAVSIWQLPTAERLARLTFPSDITQVMFNHKTAADGAALVVGTNSSGAYVYAAGGIVDKHPVQLMEESIISAISFSPDGSYFALAGLDGELNIYATRTLKHLGRIKEQHLIEQVQLENDGKQVLVVSHQCQGQNEQRECSASYLSQWKLGANTPKQRFKLPGLTKQVVFSPDQKWAAVTYHQQSNADEPIKASDLMNMHKSARQIEIDELKLIDMTTGQIRQRIPFEGIARFRFDPSSTQLLAPSNEKQLALWSLATGTRLQEFALNHNWSGTAQFDQTTQQIFIVDMQGEKTLWPILDPFNFIGQSISRLPAGRNCLTELERNKYFMAPLSAKQLAERECNQ